MLNKHCHYLEFIWWTWWQLGTTTKLEYCTPVGVRSLSWSTNGTPIGVQNFQIYWTILKGQKGLLFLRALTREHKKYVITAIIWLENRDKSNKGCFSCIFAHYSQEPHLKIILLLLWLQHEVFLIFEVYRFLKILFFLSKFCLELWKNNITTNPRF